MSINKTRLKLAQDSIAVARHCMRWKLYAAAKYHLDFARDILKGAKC